MSQYATNLLHFLVHGWAQRGETADHLKSKKSHMVGSEVVGSVLTCPMGLPPVTKPWKFTRA